MHHPNRMLFSQLVSDLTKTYFDMNVSHFRAQSQMFVSRQVVLARMGMGLCLNL